MFSSPQAIIVNQRLMDHRGRSGPAAPVGNPAAGTGRKQACNSCRQRKKRCDGNLPCTPCRKWSVLCEYAGSAERHTTAPSAVTAAPTSPVHFPPVTWQNTITKDGSPNFYSPILPPPQLPSPGAVPSPFPWSNFGATLDFDTRETHAAQQGSNLSSPGPIDLPSLPSLNWLGTPQRARLPSQADVLSLTESFFERVHPLLPTIQKRRYLNELQKNFAEDPPTPLPWIICAVSVTVDSRSHFRHQAQEWFQKAKQLFDDGSVSRASPLSKLQAAAWITFYLFTKAQFLESSLLLAKAFRFACHCGLNRLDADERPPKNFVIPQDALELEEYRGAMWALYYMDRQLSCLSGMPLVIDDRFYCVNFPADGVLQYGESHWPTYPRNFTTDLRIPPPPSPDNPDPLAGEQIPICWIYKSSVLLGRILDLCNTPHKPTPPSKEREEDFIGLGNTISRFMLSLPRSITDFLNESPQNADRAAWLCLILHVCSILLQQSNPGTALDDDSDVYQTTSANSSSSGIARAFSFARSVLRLLSQTTQNLPTTNALKNPFLGVVYLICCRLLVLRQSSEAQQEAGSHSSDIDLILLLVDRMGESWSPLAQRYRRVIESYSSKDQETLAAEVRAGGGCLVDFWDDS